jgi:hypothetical protein
MGEKKDIRHWQPDSMQMKGKRANTLPGMDLGRRWDTGIGREQIPNRFLMGMSA